MANPKTNDDPEGEGKGAKVKKPTLTINVYSWGTLIFGVLMLFIGLLGGYLMHPYIPLGSSSSAEAAAPLPDFAEDTQPAVESPVDAATREEMMDFLVSQTRHLKGDPDASVMVLEFSDFQ